MSITEQMYSHVRENMNHRAKENLEKFIQNKELFLNLHPKHFLTLNRCKKTTRDHSFRMTRVVDVNDIIPLA
ncbi:MAG: hypothetical protein ACTH3I_12330 [Staphylococcus equorum]